MTTETFTLNISPDIRKKLDVLAKQSGCSKSEIVRRGIAVMFAVHEGTQRGLRLTLSSVEGVVKAELVLP